MPNGRHARKSAAIYTPLILKLYDGWVLGVSNRFAWRCPTRAVLLPFFRRHIGSRHMDVGVGTGFYLANAGLHPDSEVTLLDLSISSLNAAKARIKHIKTQSVRHDVTLPLPFPEHTVFDSISLFYLLHCLPGKFSEKRGIIINLKRHLSPDGVVYGATILGEEANHNWFGRKLMKLYNRKGIFGNRDDTMRELKEMLESSFRSVDILRHGKVALFAARGDAAVCGTGS
jgi:SAM-dependent methyltransferase